MVGGTEEYNGVRPKASALQTVPVRQYAPQVSPVTVTSLDDPRLEPYRNQRDAWLAASHNPSNRAPSPENENHGLFMAEGLLVIRALLASGYRVHSFLATPARFEAIEAEVAAKAPGAPVFLAAPALMEDILGFDMHRGLLAAGRRRPPPAADEVIARSRLLVLAEDLSNHDNVGGLFRTVAALAGAAAGVLLSPRCCDPLYRKALRVSMGHALAVPWTRLEPWPDRLNAVAEAGFRILALSPTARTSIRRLDLAGTQRVALLVGAEGPGLAAETLATLGSRIEPVSIPMRGGVDSLNVVVAMGVALDRVVGSIRGECEDR